MSSRRILAVILLSFAVAAPTAQGARRPVAGPAVATGASASAASVSWPRMLKRPAIRGTARVGQVLRATRGRWSAQPSRRVTGWRYSWMRCSAAGRKCKAVAGAHSRRYKLRAKDVGHRMRFRVVALRRVPHSRMLQVAAMSRATKIVRALAGGGPGGTGSPTPGPNPGPTPGPGPTPPPPAAGEPPVPALVSLGQDCAFCRFEGPNAPFSKMNEDILWPIDTTNGTAIDDSPLNGIDVKKWVADAHAHGNLALVSIGGSDDQNWSTACNSTNRAGFAANLVDWFISRGFDGVSLDQEDNTLSAQGPPSDTWTACATAVANTAHATKTHAGHVPIVAQEVITPWQGQWIAPYKDLIDQYDLMTYGDTCSSNTDCASFASDIATLTNDLCPGGGACAATEKQKMVVGLDMAEYPGDVATCGRAAVWAKNNGLRGAFDFVLGSDRDLGANFPCQSAIANGLGL